MFELDRFSDNRPNYYEVAQICLNGHIITDSYNRNPELRKNFCPKCGAKTIYQCPNCNINIQGDYVVPGVFAGGISNAPSFCHNCGQMYPWTETRLDVARQLTMDADELGDDREKLANSLPDLVSDTPRTTVAVSRWKKAFEKLGEHTAVALREIFIDVASETAKKLLFPG